MVNSDIRISQKDNYYVVAQHVQLSIANKFAELFKVLFFTVLSVLTLGLWSKPCALKDRAWKVLKTNSCVYQAKIDGSFLRNYKVLQGKVINPQAVAKQLRKMLDQDKLKPLPEKFAAKVIQDLPKEVLAKIFEDGLDKKEKAKAAQVCDLWNKQLKNLAKQERANLKNHIETFIPHIDRNNLKVIREIRDILNDKEINATSLTYHDRLKHIPKKLFKILKDNQAALKNNIEIIKAILLYDGKALLFASAELKDNREVVEIAVSQNGLALLHASDELKNNFEIVKTAVSQDVNALQYASVAIKSDLDMIKDLVSQNGLALQFVSDALKNNMEVVEMAVSQNGLALQYASLLLKDNLHIVDTAVSQAGFALKHASHALKANVKLTAKADQNGYSYDKQYETLYM